MLPTTYTHNVLRVKIGNQIDGPQFVDLDSRHHCRTDAQFRAVERLIKSPSNKLDFLCDNPLAPEPDGKRYSCAFAVTFYDTDGAMCMARITKTGCIRYMHGPHKGLYLQAIK